MLTPPPLAPEQGPVDAQHSINRLVQAYPILTHEARQLRQWGIDPEQALLRLKRITEAPAYALLPNKVAPSSASMAYLRGPATKPKDEPRDARERRVAAAQARDAPKGPRSVL